MVPLKISNVARKAGSVLIQTALILLITVLLGEASLRIFNYFRPDFSPAGAIKQAGLIAPEFQIASAMEIASEDFYLTDLIDTARTTTFNLNPVKALRTDPKSLLGYLNTLLLAGQMSNELKGILMTYMTKNSGINDEKLIKGLIALIIISSEYAIQR